MAWNCRELGGPSTISKLKEFIRLNLPNIIFLSETKQKMGFVKTVCKILKCRKRWETIELVGRSEGMFVCW